MHDDCDLRYLYDGTIWDSTCDRVVDDAELNRSVPTDPWEPSLHDPRPLSTIDDDGGRY